MRLLKTHPFEYYIPEDSSMTCGIGLGILQGNLWCPKISLVKVGSTFKHYS